MTEELTVTTATCEKGKIHYLLHTGKDEYNWCSCKREFDKSTVQTFVPKGSEAKMIRESLEEQFHKWWISDENRDLRMPMYLQIPQTLMVKLTPEDFTILLSLIGRKIKSGVDFCIKEKELKKLSGGSDV